MICRIAEVGERRVVKRGASHQYRVIGSPPVNLRFPSAFGRCHTVMRLFSVLSAPRHYARLKRKNSDFVLVKPQKFG
jgi:hypothetical protein